MTADTGMQLPTALAGAVSVALLATVLAAMPATAAPAFRATNLDSVVTARSPQRTLVMNDASSISGNSVAQHDDGTVHKGGGIADAATANLVGVTCAPVAGANVPGQRAG